jgi:hypothetical protein
MNYPKTRRNKSKGSLAFMLTLTLLLTLSSKASAQSTYSLDEWLTLESAQTEMILGKVPSIYIRSNELILKTQEESAVRVITDLKDIQTLYAPDNRYSEVEIIMINIKSEEDLRSSIDLASLKHFEELKYIYFNIFFELCDDADNLPCEKEQVQAFIGTQVPSRVQIIYTSKLSN